jgi:hypothetical protein
VIEAGCFEPSEDSSDWRRIEDKIRCDSVDPSEIVKNLNLKPIKGTESTEIILDSEWIRSSGRILN